MDGATPQPRTSSDRPESAVEAAHALRGVVGGLRRRLLAVSGTSELTPAQASTLTRIVRGDADTGSALAQVERISPQAAAVSISALADAGYIARTTDPTDGRRQIIAPTDAGREYVQSARDTRQAWLEEGFVEDFTEAERQQVIAATTLLERLLER
ncbi:MarR family transcriptional regulator [Brachybacterium endophyticum]|uniref:MarR family transcriptional regulator n=1 Tax=Brachybacterium endophyticum TaxID=2182385 RepID=A0A2U2RNR0_9MICO|nr:MarR family transcriptional regulator [Brachybacterium endophyticum]PWH07507.1 MarR family transcriptional regulator [Brachybacterium endophyticum]